MPRTQLRANATVETLNQDELAEALGQQTTTYFQELARGYTTPRFGNSAAVAAGSVQVPATDADRFGPDPGFCWRVTRISVDGLADGDTLKIYRDGVTYVGTVSAGVNFSPGKGLILRGGEFLVLRGSGLTATGDITVTGEAAGASELDIYKIL